MQIKEILELCISIVSLGILIFLLIKFFYNLVKYKFVGNRYFYVIISFLICLGLSLFVNFSNKNANVLIPIGSSVLDAVKMVVLSFNAEKLTVFYKATFFDIFFIVQYVFASVVTFVFLSLSVVLSFFKSFASSATSWKRKHGKNAKIYYIFTDSKVTVSLKLAKELLEKKEGEKGNAVTLYVSTASLKTQEGTEFRDMLLGNKIHVRAEAFSEKLAAKFVEKYFKKDSDKEVVIYCMFSNNDAATALANNFQAALRKNELFNELNDKLQPQFNAFKEHYNYDDVSFKGIDKSVLDKFKIFVTYHDTDIDLIYKYSKNTLHIINTLSQYDMISSRFLFDYPIIKFVDFGKIQNEKNVDSMHVTFFGLGSVNRPIFEKMTYAYQLWGDNVHKVHYHIVDRNASSKVEAITNEYTSKSKEKFHPFIYDVDGALDGQDLTEYEVIDKYVKEIKEGDNRFKSEGFEMFVVSFGNTNADLMAAINLRNALVKYVDGEKLKKTYIFVRRSDGEAISECDLPDSAPRIIFDKGFNFDNKKPVPIVIYGDNALMPTYIKEHYNRIIKCGIESEYAYAVCHYLEDKDADLEELKEKVEYLWLDKDKLDVLKNTRVVYTLDSKEALLKLASEAQIKEMEKAETYEKYDVKNPIIKIANLEHNRWLATNYLLLKSKPLDFKTYLDGNHDKTKRNEEHAHVCMVTNEGLRKLYDEVKKTNPKLAYSKFYQIDIKTAEMMLNNEELK